MTLKKLILPDSGAEDRVYGVDYNALLDAFEPVEASMHSNSLDHSHSNKVLLDTYTQYESSLADAVNKAHNSSLDPSSDEKDALAGTTGTPSANNKYVTDSDSRLEGGGSGDMAKTVYDTNDDGKVDDSEKLEGSTLAQVQDHPPQTHGTNNHTGTVGSWSQIDKTTSDIADITSKSHTSLTDKGTNTHPQLDAHLETTHYGYTLSVQALTSSPVDAQTVYFGQLPKAPITTANISKVYVRKAGTIKAANIYCYSGTAGTAESWSIYIRKNNSTDTLIATLAVSANERVFTNSSLSIAMAAGDYFEIKVVNASWATNPLTTIFGGYIYLE